MKQENGRAIIHIVSALNASLVQDERTAHRTGVAPKNDTISIIYLLFSFLVLFSMFLNLRLYSPPHANI